jgi:hypothetical protein
VVVAVVVSVPAAIANASPDSSSSECGECCSDEGVRAAHEDLRELRGTIDELVPETGLANALDAKVDTATRSVLAARYDTAINQIDAFGNQVAAAENSGSGAQHADEHPQGEARHREGLDRKRPLTVRGGLAATCHGRMVTKLPSHSLSGPSES